VAELVGVAEIAEKLGVPRTTVSMWDARRVKNGFPLPVADLRMGPVYEWQKVESWYQDRASA
jgi:chromosome partitioning protein